MSAYLSKLFKGMVFGGCLVWASLLGLNAEVKDNEEALSPTRDMRAETIYMVRFMEELHLEHRNISSLDNKAILVNFFEELDPNHMILLQEEVDHFIKKFEPTLDVFVSGGSLIPAFTIFDAFRKEAYTRLDWVIERLDKPFDFSQNGEWAPDRKEATWPITETSAHQLWTSRLKYEIITETLGLCANKEEQEKKPEDISIEHLSGEEIIKAHMPKWSSSKYTLENFEKHLPQAIENLKKRYASWKRSYKEFDSWLVEEMFLNSIAKMYDPHTVFLSKDSFEDLSIHIKNALIGIGAELKDENGLCTINKLTPGGPAKLSGEFHVGDKIVGVAQGDDGEFVDVVGMRLYKIVRLLRGKKDTVVRVKVETVAGEIKTVRLVRDYIKLNASRASATYFEIKEEDGQVRRLGVIDLPSFYGDAGDEVGEDGVSASKDIRQLIDLLKEKQVEGIVLDLRQNGGGLLNQAVDIAGLFITSGPVVQVKDSFGNVEQYCDEDNQVAWGGPLVVLTSSMSASASEILVGALRDNQRAVVVGAEATHGKGSVQAALDMNMFFNSLNGQKDLGAGYITIQKWYLPTGTSIQLKGVSADIKLQSLDECFHKREADYPHALLCDTVPAVDFDYTKEAEKLEGHVVGDLVSYLKERSEQRQQFLEEFSLFKERRDNFDKRVNRKNVSLNAEECLQERQKEEARKEEMEERVRALTAKVGYFSEPVLLPGVLSEEDEISRSEDDKKIKDLDGISSFDTNLRESLRILSDLVDFLKRSGSAK